MINCKTHGSQPLIEGACTRCWKDIEDHFNELSHGIDIGKYWVSAGVREALSNLNAAVARQERRKNTYK